MLWGEHFVTAVFCVFLYQGFLLNISFSLLQAISLPRGFLSQLSDIPRIYEINKTFYQRASSLEASDFILEFSNVIDYNILNFLLPEPHVLINLNSEPTKMTIRKSKLLNKLRGNGQKSSAVINIDNPNLSEKLSLKFLLDNSIIIGYKNRLSPSNDHDDSQSAFTNKMLTF